MARTSGGAAAKGPVTDPVDFHKLKALLPETLPGLKRAEASGQKTAGGEINVSTAKADYRGIEGNAAHLTIEITDCGGTEEFRQSMVMWMQAEVERESDTGYEKTILYQHHKAHEQYDSKTKTGLMVVLVADRFLVRVEGRHVTAMDPVKGALAQIDVNKLAAMKNEGVH